VAARAGCPAGGGGRRWAATLERVILPNGGGEAMTAVEKSCATPWLSVILTVHDRNHWLGEALRSLADQHDDAIEVIAVDGSETDTGWRIINGFADRLNLRPARRRDLQSQTEKINFGVAAARADWISILHDDDFWMPSRAAALKTWIATAPDAVMHLHPSYVVDGSGRRFGVWRCPLPVTPSPAPRDALLRRLLVQNFISAPAPVIRRAAFLRVGGMDEALWFAPDWDLYLKLAPLGAVYYHPEPLTGYRVHPQALTIRSSQDAPIFRRQYEIVLNRHLGELGLSDCGRLVRAGQASIDVNVALAAAVRGNYAEIPRALVSLLRLGPNGLREYFIASRIIDRALPRLQALLAARLHAQSQLITALP
jgi:glycosyltransferase involved in cell wall biosynthesis